VRVVALFWGVIAVAAAGVQAADVAVDGDAYPTVASDPVNKDASLELSWDNGTRQWNIAWYTGTGAWVGNEFDLGTISTYRAIRKIKFYSRSNWPNAQWDGFHLGVFNFSGGIPGSMLWPTGGGGYFFKPTGLSGHVWVEINIGWTCPAVTFVAAEGQYYNWPNCDPFAVDTNANFSGHSWEYYGGSWSPLSTAADPYRNLMLRVIVDDETLAVAPASLGRVKALYR